jgi:hypothetical protein
MSNTFRGNRHDVREYTRLDQQSVDMLLLRFELRIAVRAFPYVSANLFRCRIGHVMGADRLVKRSSGVTWRSSPQRGSA